MINFNTMAELIEMAAEKDLPIHEIVIAREMHDTQRSKDEILAGMQTNWQVMQASIERGIKNQEHSVSGLTGGDSKRLYDYRQQGYMGEQVLAAARENDVRLEQILLTHAHIDHAGGTAELARTLNLVCARHRRIGADTAGNVNPSAEKWRLCHQRSSMTGEGTIAATAASRCSNPSPSSG